MPTLSGGGRGDLYVTVKLRLPTSPSEDEVELYRQLRDLRGKPTKSQRGQFLSIGQAAGDVPTVRFDGKSME